VVARTTLELAEASHAVVGEAKVAGCRCAPEVREFLFDPES
jgi:hypothetical protein